MAPKQERSTPDPSSQKSDAFDSAEAYYQRGIEYSQRGDIELAIRDFDMVIQLNLNDVMYYRILFLCMIKMAIRDMPSVFSGE